MGIRPRPNPRIQKQANNLQTPCKVFLVATLLSKTLWLQSEETQSRVLNATGIAMKKRTNKNTKLQIGIASTDFSVISSISFIFLPFPCVLWNTYVMLVGIREVRSSSDPPTQSSSMRCSGLTRSLFSPVVSLNQLRSMITNYITCQHLLQLSAPSEGL